MLAAAFVCPRRFIDKLVRARLWGRMYLIPTGGLTSPALEFISLVTITAGADERARWEGRRVFFYIGPISSRVSSEGVGRKGTTFALHLGWFT